MPELSIFDNSDKQIVAIDEKGIIVYINKILCEALFYNESELLGLDLSLIISDEKGKTNIEHFKSCTSLGYPLAMKSKFGIETHIEITSAKAKVNMKDIWIIFLNEIPAAVQTEYKSNLINIMVNTISDFIYIKDINGAFLSCNKAFADILVGLPESEILGKTDFDIIKIKEMADRCTSMDSLVIQTCKPCSYEEKLILADNRKIIVDTMKVPYFDDKKNVKYVIGISRNITQRKYLEEALAKENKKINFLCELYNKASKHERLDKFINYVREVITNLYNIDGMLFYLFSESRNKMLLFSYYGIDNEFIDTISVLDESDVYSFDLFNEIIMQNRVDDCPDCSLKECAQKGNFRYFSLSTINFHKKMLGCVIIFQKENKLTDEQLSFLPSVCEAVAVVINNYMLNEKQKRDYMELLSLENKVLQAKVAAESESKAKSMFLATMSHEIRTPLNGIIGFLDLLSQSELSKEQSGYVTSAMDASKALLPIVNDILDYSKVKSGGLVLEQIKFQLLDIVNNVITFHTPRVNERGLTIELRTEKNLPQYVIGDPTRLKEILNNLLSNAIKFTSAGKIEVSINQVCAHNSEVTLEFSVSDTGIGIAEEKLKQLFNPYSQAESSTTRNYGGTGLGLAICKALVERMGGNIRAISAPNAGSIFFFTIKVALPKESSDEKTENLKSEKYNFQKDVRILLAEDNEINQRLIILMLKKYGLNCDIACNGIEAVKAATEKDYDIVFMDCQMPEMDGYEATTKIRESEAGKRHSIIIAMTGNIMIGEREKCLSTGMDDYISKPINFSDMYDLIIKNYKQIK